MNMNSLRVMQATIFLLCLSMAGLQAGRIPLQNDQPATKKEAWLQAGRIPLQKDQPATKKEGEDAFELGLQFKGEWVPCADIDMHADYCLAPRPAGMLSRAKQLKIYLNNRLVYNCSSSGICTAQGALKENTRIKVASEGCEGIPFANINKDLIGEYVALVEDPPERYKASFNLTFCNRKKSLKLGLKLREKAANCVSQSDHDGYCLFVWMDGQPIKNRTFTCYLGSQLAYECSAEGVCKGHGILQDNVRPNYVASDCSGIPFANVVPQAAGGYSCVVEDDTLLIEAHYYLKFCSERNNVDLILTKNGVEATCIDNQSADIREYCLSIASNKIQLYEEYNVTVDGSPRHSCNSSHACSGKGVSGACSGIQFTSADDAILGNYSFTAKTQSGSIVTGSYVLNYCQGSPPTSNATGLEMEKTKSGWNNVIIIVSSTVLVFICVGIGWVVYKKYCRKQPDNDNLEEHDPLSGSLS